MTGSSRGVTSTALAPARSAARDAPRLQPDHDLDAEDDQEPREVLGHVGPGEYPGLVEAVGRGEQLVIERVDPVALADQLHLGVGPAGRDRHGPEEADLLGACREHLDQAERDDRLAALRLE